MLGISEIIQKVIKDRLYGVNVIDVQTSEDFDFDGDRILRVKIILGCAEPLNHASVVGMVRHIRERLDEEDETAFPILSYVSAKEAGLGSAAA